MGIAYCVSLPLKVHKAQATIHPFEPQMLIGTRQPMSDHDSEDLKICSASYEAQVLELWTRYIRISNK